MFRRSQIDCALCGDAGWIAILPDGQTMPMQDVPGGTVFSVRECSCAERIKFERALHSSHITEEFQQLGFRNFATEGRPQSVATAYEAAKQYLSDFERVCTERCNSIALLGRPGCGKTHLLVAIANNLMRKGHRVMYFPWVEGLNEIRDDLDAAERKFDHMRRVEVLYIDDLYKGRRSPTDWMLEQLFGVVNYRYINHKPVLVSSEKTVDELCSIDEGIGSRIYEMARNYTVLLGLTQTEANAGMKLNYRLR